MSVGWVIDATIGVSWVHTKQSTVEAAQLLQKATAGMLIVVPSLWFPEIANVLLVLERRGKISGAERADSLRAIQKMRLDVDDESILAALRAASDLASTHGLSVYDATYLEVALRRNLGLATRDAALNRAAKACSVKTF